MMDEREDRLDELIRDAAQEYHAPPPAPRAEMWTAIRAARDAAGRTAARPLPFPARRSSPLRYAVGIAAILALGVALGRLSVQPGADTAPGSDRSTMAATPDSGADTLAESGRDRGEAAARFATDDHLGQVEIFLTEFGSMPAAGDFSAQARDLLGNTRMLLDSKRVTDTRTRQLLQDLELILAQIATLARQEDRELIADGLAQSHLRTRIRNAIPAGGTIRL